MSKSESSPIAQYWNVLRQWSAKCSFYSVSCSCQRGLLIPVTMSVAFWQYNLIVERIQQFLMSVQTYAIPDRQKSKAPLSEVHKDLLSFVSQVFCVPCAVNCVNFSIIYKKN